MKIRKTLFAGLLAFAGSILPATAYAENSKTENLLTETMKGNGLRKALCGITMLVTAAAPAMLHAEKPIGEKKPAQKVESPASEDHMKRDHFSFSEGYANKIINGDTFSDGAFYRLSGDIGIALSKSISLGADLDLRLQKMDLKIEPATNMVWDNAVVLEMRINQDPKTEDGLKIGLGGEYILYHNSMQPSGPKIERMRNTGGPRLGIMYSSDKTDLVIAISVLWGEHSTNYSNDQSIMLEKALVKYTRQVGKFKLGLSADFTHWGNSENMYNSNNMIVKINTTPAYDFSGSFSVLLDLGYETGFVGNDIYDSYNFGAGLKFRW